MARRLLARRDELEREVAERTAALAASETHFRLLIENGSDLITVLEADGTTSYLSPSTEHVLGYRPEELLGQNIFTLVHSDDAPGLMRVFRDRLADGRSGTPYEFRCQHKDGSWRVLEAVGNRLPDGTRMVINSHDITARQQDEAALRRMALFDDLTGLPNRTLLQDRLEQALREAERSGSPVAVLLMDLDRFKDMNDTFGHQIGASIGIAEHTEHETNVQELIRRADVAMYVAKRDKSDYAVYATDQDRHTANRLAMASDLRRALEDGQLELHYQPKVLVATGQPAGVEALIRWRRDENGFVPPDTFIPIAEETGLIYPLTRWD